MEDITVQQLEAVHASNPQRVQLLAKFRTELAGWTDYLAALNVWLFGSYLTAKIDPGDIDVLLAGRLKPVSIFAPPKLPRPHKSDIHVISILGTGGLATREELIKKFNEHEGNAEKGIQVSPDQIAKLVI